jgi:hypothetical protein
MFHWLAGTCQPVKQQHCGILKFRSCYFCNIMQLDDRGVSVFTRIFEQWNSILAYTLYMFFLYISTHLKQFQLFLKSSHISNSIHGVTHQMTAFFDLQLYNKLTYIFEYTN